MSAQPLQPLPQFTLGDRVSWLEGSIEHKGRYIGPDPQRPSFSRVEPDHKHLLPDGENSILLHPSQLKPIAAIEQPQPQPEPETKPARPASIQDTAAAKRDPAAARADMLEAVRTNCRGAAYGTPEFLESFSQKHNLSDEEVRALWKEQRELLSAQERPSVLQMPDPKRTRPAEPTKSEPTPKQIPAERPPQNQFTPAASEFTKPQETKLVPDFETIARAAIGRGEPHVVPIVIGGKNPAIKWKNDPDYNVDMYSTPEMNQISDKWIQALLNRSYKKFNAAVIARPDNVLFIDDDKHAEFVAAYEKWSGEKFPRTYATSARENRWQLHFYQTDKTRELGNIIQTQVDGLDFSVRQSNEYVVAEGSIYKDGVNVYRRVDDSPIVPMPDKLVEFIMKKVAESGRTKSSPAKATINEDGTRKLIPQGFIHDALFAQAKLLRDAGLSPSGIESALLGWYHENCEPPAAGREAAASEKIKQVAASVGSAGQLTIGDLPVGAGSVAQQVGKPKWFSYFYHDDDGEKLKETVRFAYPAVNGSYRDYVVSPSLGQKDGWFPLGSPSVEAGSSGTGKTTWTMDLLEKQLAKDPVCGHNTYGRPYVVIMVDRGEDSNRRTLERLGIDADKVTVKYISPSTGADAMIAVKNKIEEDGPDAIPQIVFVEGADMLVQDVNKGPFVSEFLTRAQGLAKHYHLALILSVGSPKQKLGEGYVAKRDNILGSEKWGRMSETVVIMSYVKHDDMGNKRVCSVLPRNAPPEEFKYAMSQAGQLMPDTSETTPETARTPEIDWFKDQAAAGKTDPTKQWWTALDLQRGLNVGHSTAGRYVKDSFTKKYIVKKRGRKDAKGCSEQYQWNESATNPLWTPDPPREEQEIDM